MSKNAFKQGLKDRMQNKVFWISLVSISIILIQQICDLFGIKIDLSSKQDALLAILNNIFVLLAVIGVIIEPTTPGLKDGIKHYQVSEEEQTTENDN